MKLLLKNTFKKIRKSLGRFFSITFIIALGISVFMGLRESTAGMLYTADNYYDKSNLMDFKITSTHGLTDDDIKSLKDLEYIEKVIPSYSIDVLENGKSIRLHSIEKEINNVTLIEGRTPDNNNECLGDYYKYKIGDIINFERKNISDYIKINSCKIVGTINSTLYIRNEKGISNVGNGKLISFIFVNKDIFKIKYYTDIYITAKESINKNSYYDDYSEQISLLRTELEKLKPIRETIRYEEILVEANNEIINIKKELDKKINEANNNLKKTKQELDIAYNKLKTNKSETIKYFENNYQLLNNNKELIIQQLSQLNIEIKQLDNTIIEIYNNITLLQEQLQTTIDQEQKNIINVQISDLQSKYDSLIEINETLFEIENGLNDLDNNYNQFEIEIEEQEKKIENGYIKYYKGLNDLEKVEEETNKKIEEAKEEINNIEKPKWYLLDRSYNSGYNSYKEDIIKVDAIAKVLPVFFILIVILMISNTLTRLIEEERTEIGILLSNGFSKSSIIFSYLVYVFIAGLIGIVIGLTIGYSLFPTIIYGVFLSRYYVPKLITIVSPLPFSLVIIITLFIMTIVTIISCSKELKQVPATLLRPKPPKSGKNIIVEKVNILWSKLSFIWKNTIRNLFRYKKRIIMTILGVAGCTALLLSGMGINDSINTISKIQYNDIIKYDSMYILENNINEIPNELLNILLDNGVVNPLLIKQNSYTFSFENKTEDVYLIVPSNIISFNNYVSLKNIDTNKNISIENNGAIITEQMAKLLNVKKGDILSIRNSDNELFLIYISDIVKNYVSHYIYMNENYYNEVFNKDVEYNTIIADGNINEKIALTEYNILTVNNTKDILNTFDSFIKGLNKIIILIVVCACFLAFIVLYNLTIINVSERKREIATFKVLGFYDKEISNYVYRETIILTIFGILLGLFLGIYLHKFIINTAETNNIMFLKQIKWYSYSLSAIITIIFSYIVQLIININLRKINMIDSLKSVE
ncbi:MAG: FtsX-like permease family protein [Bacilli bacterium]|nr:FtsX-like permease family protein [Bacilli bacterium]